MFYHFSFQRDDIGTIDILVPKTSKEPRYDAVAICNLVGVQNVKTFLLSITYDNGGLNIRTNMDGSFKAWANKVALISIFNKLKEDGYAPVTLNIVMDAFNDEVFPYAEKEVKKLLKKKV